LQLIKAAIGRFAFEEDNDSSITQLGRKLMKLESTIGGGKPNPPFLSLQRFDKTVDLLIRKVNVAAHSGVEKGEIKGRIAANGHGGGTTTHHRSRLNIITVIAFSNASE
jgi:hypothetical protein